MYAPNIDLIKILTSIAKTVCLLEYALQTWEDLSFFFLFTLSLHITPLFLYIVRIYTDRGSFILFYKKNMYWLFSWFDLWELILKWNFVIYSETLEKEIPFYRTKKLQYSRNKKISNLLSANLKGHFFKSPYFK